MFEGIEVTGVAEMVLSRGRVVVEGGKFFGHAGEGEFLRRSTYSQINA
jgi:dihydropyrimidinase